MKSWRSVAYLGGRDWNLTNRSTTPFTVKIPLARANQKPEDLFPTRGEKVAISELDLHYYRSTSIQQNSLPPQKRRALGHAWANRTATNPSNLQQAPRGYRLR